MYLKLTEANSRRANYTSSLPIVYNNMMSHMINADSCSPLYREMICYTMLHYLLPWRTVLQVKRLSHRHNSSQLRTVEYKDGAGNQRVAHAPCPPVARYCVPHARAIPASVAPCQSVRVLQIILVARELTPRLLTKEDRERERYETMNGCTIVSCTL